MTGCSAEPNCAATYTRFSALGSLGLGGISRVNEVLTASGALAGGSTVTAWANVNGLLGIRWTRFYHGGLSGIAVDPDYAKNRFVYVVTQTPSRKERIPITM